MPPWVTTRFAPQRLAHLPLARQQGGRRGSAENLAGRCGRPTADGAPSDARRIATGLLCNEVIQSYTLGALESDPHAAPFAPSAAPNEVVEMIPMREMEDEELERMSVERVLFLDLAEMRSQIQNKGKELEDQLKLDQARIEGPIKRKLLEIIQETGKEAGFTLILQRGGAGMLYSREALDIKDLIVETYNQKG